MSQTEELPECLSGLVIEDLDSGYATWPEDVQRVLRSPFGTESVAGWDQTADWLQIPTEKLHERLAALRYVLLVDQLAILEIRGWARQSECDQDRPHRIKDMVEKPRDGENGNLPEGYDESPIHSRQAVVDLAGCYVPSVEAFFSRRSGALAERVRALVSARGDGPGVILCPQNIAGFHEIFLTRLKGRLTRQPVPRDNPLGYFLRATLLHEIGHHVFPVSDGGWYEYLSEGLAHLFAAAHFSDDERLWLYAKSEVQPIAYAAWRVLWVGLRPHEKTWRARQALPAWFAGTVPRWSLWSARIKWRGPAGYASRCWLNLLDERLLGAAWVVGEECGDDSWSADKWGIRDPFMFHDTPVIDWRAGATDLDLAWKVLHLLEPPTTGSAEDIKLLTTQHAIKVLPRHTSFAVADYLEYLHIENLRGSASLIDTWREVIPALVDNPHSQCWVARVLEYCGIQPSELASLLGPQIAKWRLDLKAGDPKAQASAAHWLGLFTVGDPIVSRELLGALDQATDPVFRWNILEALGRLMVAGPEVFDVLIGALTNALNERDPRTRYYAMDALKRLDLAATAALALMTHLAGNGDEQVRRNGVQIMGLLGDSSPEVLDMLIGTLNEDSAEFVRGYAASALGQLGTAAPMVLEALTEAVHSDSEWSVRKSAAEALGQLGAVHPAVLEVLTTALGHDRMVRLKAAEALGKIGVVGPEVQRTLGSLVKELTAEDSNTRGVAAQALERLGLAAPAALALTNILREDHSRSAGHAAEMLGVLGVGEPTIVEALMVALGGDSDEDVRRHAAEALGQLSSATPAVVKALTTALSDSGERVRWHAAEALGKIGSDDSATITALRLALAADSDWVAKEVFAALENLNVSVEP